MRIANVEPGELAVILADGVAPVGRLLVARGLLSEASMVELIASYASLIPVLPDAIASAQRMPLEPGMLRAPVESPSKIWAAASNYRRGTADLGGRGRGETTQLDPEAVLELSFLKPPSAIVRPGGHIIIPSRAASVFPEVELCVVIGKEASRVSPRDAMDFVFGYTVILDVTARQYGTGQNLATTRCIRKGFDTFAPLGPWIATREEILDSQRLTMRLRVNGEMVQLATTEDMINDVPSIVSYLSHVSTLYPGDLIATGNPDAPAFQRQLAPGDTIEAEIEGIGVLPVGVARAEGAPAGTM